jgi:hypothetical protein
VGGGFTCIGPATNTNLCGQTGGTPRDRIAALQVSNGAATAWNPDANSSVEAIEVSGNIVYVGGTFTPTPVVPNSIGGQPRNNIAALDASTGLATPWNPNVNAAVHTLALAGSTVYAGGEFDSAGGETPRNNIAAFNETTGAITAANPNVNGPVNALATFGNTVYVGGDFTTLSGGALLRNGIAALDTTSGAPSLWNPTATGGGVKALAVSPDGNTVYAGGDFTAIGGALRSHIAALTTAGSATAWDPGADGTVYALATINNKVYVGGSFTTIGGAPRSNLAFLKGTGTTNLLQPWDPSPNLPVYAILVGSTTACTSGTGLTSTVYIGGEFTSLSGGAQRVHIAAIKSSGSGTICTWRPDAIGGPVRALALSGDSLFIGGDFTSAGGVSPLNRLAAVDVISGSASSWNPNANSSVRALAVSNVTGTLYTGGSFSTLAGSTNPTVGLPRNNFAAFTFGTLLALVTPLSSAVQVGGLAAAFVGVYNGTSTLATNVTIAPKTPITGSPPFHFFPYNPATGFGTPDTPVNIPPGGQVFLVSFAPGVEINPPTFPPTEVKFAIEGTNTTRAASITGLNTLFLAASTTPITNIFAVTLAPLYTLPGPSGAAVFVVPSVNLGAGSAITVLPKGTGDVDSNNVILQICQANPTTGACLASPGSNVNVNPFASGAAAYFNIFVQGLGNSIPCDLIANRIFIEFREGSSTGPLRGVASVVLCTL